MLTSNLSEGLPVERIIDGIVYEGKLLPDVWDISVFEVNGHRELSARNAVEWVEAGIAGRDVSRDWGDGYLGAPTPEQLAKWAKQDAADEEDRRLKQQRKAAARAKSKARRFIKEEGFDEMLTLTYRKNQTDRELAKKHLKEWVRRMKVALGGQFRYCAGPEPQERGAWHWHVATNKLPAMAKHKGVKVKAWEVGTRIWRDVVGPVEIEGPLLPGQERPVMPGGLCYVGGKPRNPRHKRRRNMSIGKIAAYISKYILKDCENNPAEKNRYSRSNSAPRTHSEVAGPLLPGEKRRIVSSGPVKTNQRWYGLTLTEVIERAFRCSDGDSIVSHRIGPFKDSYWLVTEPLTDAMRYSPDIE